ncbi:YkvA family protein [Segeticoccus rhizosphaerae]|jgi:uncharacterized membrane protein YkvA (DUF1232 family)|uniref:YkvA family protein n=1 Tax=Segeticoccus rhizosphaerae TaxID=1104777 RepID=UPI0010C0FF0D|nr:MULTISPECIES: YkvA family protein [Intrasporangiaceae]
MASSTWLRWDALRSLVTAVRASTRAGSPGLLTRVAALPRLTLATVRGDYRGATVRELLILLGAVAYVVSPVDLMPEAVLGVFGLGDDAVVVGWVAVTVVNLTEDFLAWEGTRPHRRAPDVVPGDVIG